MSFKSGQDQLEELQDAITLDMIEEIQQLEVSTCFNKVDLEDEKREVVHRHMVQIKTLSEKIKEIKGQVEEIGNQINIFMVGKARCKK